MSQLTQRENIEHWRDRIIEALTGIPGELPTSPEAALVYAQKLAGLANELLDKIQRQRRELRRLNKPGHWAHLACKVHEQVSREIDDSLKRMGIALPMKVKN